MSANFKDNKQWSLLGLITINNSSRTWECLFSVEPPAISTGKLGLISGKKFARKLISTSVLLMGEKSSNFLLRKISNACSRHSKKTQTSLITTSCTLKPLRKLFGKLLKVCEKTKRKKESRKFRTS